MAFDPVRPGTQALARSVQQVIDAWQGVSGKAQPFSMTSLRSSAWAFTVRNLDTASGGHHFRVLKSNDPADVLVSVDDTGVTLKNLAFTGGLGIPIGAVSAPGIYVQSDPDTGLYSATSNELDVAVGGLNRLQVTQSGIYAIVYDKGGAEQNVKAYGAVGDGSVDDTAAIQAAIDAGGKIVFPPGRYKITATLQVGNGTASAVSTRQGIAMVGQGRVPGLVSSDVLVGGTETAYQLHGYPSLLWFGASGGTMLAVNGPIANVRIERLGFDCRSIAATAVKTFDLQESELADLKAINYTGAAFDIRAYCWGDAPGALISAYGSSNCVYRRLRAFSWAATAVGIAVGSPSVPDDTAHGHPSSGGPFAANLLFEGCYVDQLGGTAGNIALKLRACQLVSFVRCRFMGDRSISVEPPAETSAVPADVSFIHCQVDNGGTIIQTVGTWSPTDRLLFLGHRGTVSGGLGSSYGYGLTTRGHAWGDWTFEGALAISGAFSPASVSTAGNITSTAGNIAAPSGSVSGGSLSTTGAISGASLSATGQVAGATVVSTSGAITAANGLNVTTGSATITAGGLNVGTTGAAAGAIKATGAIISTGGTVSGTGLSTTGAISGGSVSATGQIAGATVVSTAALYPSNQATYGYTVPAAAQQLLAGDANAINLGPGWQFVMVANMTTGTMCMVMCSGPGNTVTKGFDTGSGFEYNSHVGSVVAIYHDGTNYRISNRTAGAIFVIVQKLGQ